eukprot:gene14322-15811_t
MAGKPMFFTFRKHLKKSIFAACLALYGGYYTVGRFREYLVRRELCNEATKIGAEPIAALQKPRCMYVVLNPQANDGKALKLYEKNVAPLLYLAGIDVTLIKTDYEGHAKSLPGYIDPNTDGIVIAGGGGTLMEVATGLIRLQDKEVVSKIPIGVVPLGRTNMFCRNFYNNAAQDARSTGNATMAIIKGETKMVDVLEIESGGVRSTYALSGITWGLFQQAKVKIDAKKHWWAGPWKKQMAFVSRTVKNWPNQFWMSLVYWKNNSEGLCEELGQQEDVSLKAREENGVLKFAEISDKRTLLHKIDEGAIEKDSNAEPDASDSIENNQTELPTVQTSAVHIMLDRAGCDSKLDIQTWKADITRSEFISDGWKWLQSNYGKVDTSNCQTVACDKISLEPKSDELTWYAIDGEEFEAKPIKVKINRDKLRFFC